MTAPSIDNGEELTRWDLSLDQAAAIVELADGHHTPHTASLVEAAHQRLHTGRVNRCTNPLSTVCAGCGSNIVNHQNSLLVTLAGFGESGMIDTLFEPDVEVELCVDCARPLLETSWGVQAWPYLNLNVGHVCDGELLWTPQPECDRDLDRHGWKKVYSVCPLPFFSEGRRRYHTQRSKLVNFGLFDTETEAVEHATRCGQYGTEVQVLESLVGNELQFGVTIDVKEWVRTSSD